MLPFTLVLFNMHLWDTVLGPGGRDPNSFFVSEVFFFFFFLSAHVFLLLIPLSKYYTSS